MNEPILIKPGSKLEIKGKVYVVILNHNKLDIQHKATAELREVKS